MDLRGGTSEQRLHHQQPGGGAQAGHTLTAPSTARERQTRTTTTTTRSSRSVTPSYSHMEQVSMSSFLLYTDQFGSLPLKRVFSDKSYLGKFLDEFQQKDEMFTSSLGTSVFQDASDDPSVLKKREEVIQNLQSSVDSFISIFLQSQFVTDSDPHSEIIHHLVVLKKCPYLPIFRRLCINPLLLASQLPEEENNCYHSGIPVNQLAKFCDVAILRFLCNVTVYTNPGGVILALDYLIELLKSLVTSINNLHTCSWNGLQRPIRRRTTHQSIQYLQLSLEHPVVIVDSPPRENSPPYPTSPLFSPSSSSTDPETGQPHVHVASGVAAVSPPSPEDRPAEIAASDARPKPQRKKSRLVPPNLQLLLANPDKKPHQTSKLQQSSNQSFLPRGASFPLPRSALDGGSYSGNSLSPSRAMSPPRIHSIAASMEIIPEESEPQQATAAAGGQTPPSLESMVMSSPPPREAGPTFQITESSDEESEASSRHSSLSPTHEVVRKKLSHVALRGKSPVSPTKKTIPSINVNKELKDLVNGEGRISLVAILYAISRLPSMPELWIKKEVCEKYFTLLEYCLELGLEKLELHNSTSQLHEEKPSKFYSRYIIEISVDALIHCALNMVVGCSTQESTRCRLASKHMPNQSPQLHDKFIRYLSRLHTNSPMDFQAALMKFAQTASCHKLFHFLHVVLQYCVVSHTNKKDILVHTVAYVLRITVDRLIQLDRSEEVIHQGIMTEACSFFHYAQFLFSQDYIARTKCYRHLYLYLQRIALSVVFPLSPRRLDRSAAAGRGVLFSSSSAKNTLMSSSLDGGDEADVFPPPPSPPPPPLLPPSPPLSSSPVRPKVRSHSVDSKSAHKTHSSPSSKRLSVPPAISQESSSPRASPRLRKGNKGGRGGLQKQSTVHEGDDLRPLQGEQGMEWRGLNLDLLRSRIQRLVVLMDSCEPGTVPDGGMLSSLVSLCDGTTVVSRAMVLLECSLFVKSLRSSPSTWLSHNMETSHSIMHNFKKWAEMIGEKLRLTELKERELIESLRTASAREGTCTPLLLPEEPVFPNSEASPTPAGGKEGNFTVSYTIKMSACILLLELTHFLRDPPSYLHFPVMGTPSIHFERRPSVVSIHSMEGEGAGNKPHPSAPLSPLLHYGSTLSVEEDPNVPDFYNVPPVPTESNSGYRKRRVSVYMKVNSSSKVARASSMKKQVAYKYTDGLGDTQPSRSGNVSIARRQSFSSTALHHSSHLAVAGAQIRQRKPSHSGLPNLRRKSMGSFLFKKQQLEDTTPPLTPVLLHPPSPTKSPGSSPFSKLKRSAQRAFKRKKRFSSVETPTPGSQANSPNLSSHHAHFARQSIAGAHPLLFEERRHYPWFDVVEHLILLQGLCCPEARRQRKKVCVELSMALKLVYNVESEEEPIELAEQTGGAGGGGGGGVTTSLSRTSISAIFTDAVDGGGGELGERRDWEGTGAPPPPPSTAATATLPRHGLPQNLQRSPSNRTILKAQVARHRMLPPNTRPTSRLSEQMCALDFRKMSGINIQSSIRSSSFLMASSLLDDETTIELFLEEESAFTKSQLSSSFNSKRQTYIRDSMGDFLHAPFSVLVVAAPLLHASTFANLREVAWEQLLNPSQELVQAAAAFFLLSCAKESEQNINRFVYTKVRRAGPSRQREAIRRFMVLWQSRYYVWPRMEERAQKKFYDDERQDQQSIGYSLPTTLLGSSGVPLPLPPWEPASVCVNKACDKNPQKCYRPTTLAPVVHICQEETRAVLTQSSVSGVCLTQEATSKPTNVYLGIGSEDSTGKVTISEWAAVEQTLFPRSLVSFIRFIILAMSVPCPSAPEASTLSSTTQPDAEVSEAARQAVWTCMVEDPRLFFSPLLNQFNHLYDKSKSFQLQIEKFLEGILQPFHVLLRCFPLLPPQAAHFLFNNFIGIIMRHTDHPCAKSPDIIEAVLALIVAVTPSVQGLDSKVLKGHLKKESCYTSVMVSARIRGTEKINVVAPLDSPEPVQYEVDDDATFSDIISADRQKPISLDLFKSFCLVERGKDLPLLNSLVVKDHYSVMADGQYPTFDLIVSSDQEKTWEQQMHLLHMTKMSELMRVAFSTQLLLTGPKVERGYPYSDFAQPNYKFIQAELVELSSFPRKALTSVVYEASPAALKQMKLRTSDIMLKATWTKFILQLFNSIPSKFDWSNGMVLFLNVINTALLLHCRDHTILRTCLATMLTATVKFPSVFRKDGYQMLVPTIIQLYALHPKDRIVTEALKFAWSKFYLLDGNIFLLQVIASTTTLVSQDVSVLARGGVGGAGVNLDGREKLYARAIFELLCSLDTDSKSLPTDELDIMGCCCLDYSSHDNPAQKQEERSLSDADWSRLTLKNTFLLCVTVSLWNPLVLSGAMVLVFLDHMMPFFLDEFAARGTLGFVYSSMPSLIKGCEVLTKVPRLELLSTRKGLNSIPTDIQQHLTESVVNLESPVPPASTLRTKRVSLVAQRLRHIINPKMASLDRGGGGGGGGGRGRGLEGGNGDPDVVNGRSSSHFHYLDRSAYAEKFKIRRIEDINQQVLRLSRYSLLSLCAQVSTYSQKEHSKLALRKESTVRQERIFDQQSVAVLTTIAVQLLKLGTYNDSVLLESGLSRYMSVLLPSIEWNDQFQGSLSNLLFRIIKLFKKLQSDPTKAMLLWEGLVKMLTGLTRCIQKNTVLVDNEQTFYKIKQLLDTILSVRNQTFSVPQSRLMRASASSSSLQVHQQLMHISPLAFSRAVVGLASQFICVTHHHTNPKFRYHISDLLSGKLSLKDDTFFLKVLLPLCIQLGLREDASSPSLLLEDAEFMLQNMQSKVTGMLKITRPLNSTHPSHSKVFFQGLKVMCCAFAETFTTAHWHKIANLVLSLCKKKLTVHHTQLTTASNSIQTYTEFQISLLNFFESFLLAYRVPLLFMLWPLLSEQEKQLSAHLPSISIIDHPSDYHDLHKCLTKCQEMQKLDSLFPSPSNRRSLLEKYSDELRELMLVAKPLSRSATTVNKTGSKRSRKLSLNWPFLGPRLASLKEEDDENIAKSKSNSLDRKRFLSRSKRLHDQDRPDTLKIGLSKRQKKGIVAESSLSTPQLRSYTSDKLQSPRLPKRIIKRKSPCTSPTHHFPEAKKTRAKRPPYLKELKKVTSSLEVESEGLEMHHVSFEPRKSPRPHALTHTHTSSADVPVKIFVTAEVHEPHSAATSVRQNTLKDDVLAHTDSSELDSADISLQMTPTNSRRSDNRLSTSPGGETLNISASSQTELLQDFSTDHDRLQSSELEVSSVIAESSHFLYHQFKEPH